MLNCVHDCRLLQRQIALIELGMIQTPEELPIFAQDLYGRSLFSSSFNVHTLMGRYFSGKKSPEEQNELLAKLDAHGPRPATRRTG
jgi:hypothetical protein